MRCVQCGWVVGKASCLCGASQAKKEAALIPVGTKVVARPNRGPTVMIWLAGEVVAHEGQLHKISVPSDNLGTFTPRYYWCEPDDLLPESPERARELEADTRVWALWLDSRWYPGTITSSQGPLRRVSWDDGDAMWLEVTHIVPMAVEPEPPEVGMTVVAQKWDGDFGLAQVEQQEGNRFRVIFKDGEEAWATEENIKTFPPNPFLK